MIMILDKYVNSLSKLFLEWNDFKICINMHFVKYHSDTQIKYYLLTFD